MTAVVQLDSVEVEDTLYSLISITTRRVISLVHYTAVMKAAMEICVLRGSALTQIRWDGKWVHLT